MSGENKYEVELSDGSIRTVVSNGKYLVKRRFDQLGIELKKIKLIGTKCKEIPEQILCGR